MIYIDLYELFRDMYLYGDDTIFANDNPLARTVGWTSQKTGKSWNIRIINIKLLSYTYN